MNDGEMTRAEHLEWAKKRALQYVDRNNLTEAYASMASDLAHHPELQNHAGIQLGMGLMMIGDLNTPQKMRRFIEGFH